MVLLVAVLALGATVGFRPPHAPPLYDGIGFPDEPYRWVEPPSGVQNTVAAPTVAAATVKVSKSGSSGPVSLQSRGFSAEQGPQVAFAVGEGTFEPAPGTTAVDVKATPKAPPSTPPTGGSVVSNLYAFTATSGGKKVPLAAAASVVVNLRADAPTDQTVVVCTWDGTRWNQQPTRQVGTEIYAAQLATLDPVALVKLDRGVAPTVAAPTPAATADGPADPSATPAADGASSRTLLLTIGGIVVLLAAALLVLRRRTGGE
jgi:hypothetical protein